MVQPVGELIGELIPRQVLGIEFEEPSPIAYLDSKAGVHYRRENGVDHFEVSWEHPALDGMALLQFLDEVAPNKSPSAVINHGQYTTLADWSILSPVHYESNSFLANKHIGLGQGWTEFVASCPAFTDVIEDATPPILRFAEAFTSEHYLRLWTLRYASDKYSGSIASIVGELERLGVENAQDLVIHEANESTRYGRRSRGETVVDAENAEDYYASWGKPWQEMFGHQVYSNLPQELQEQIIDEYYPEYIPQCGCEVITTDKGTPLAFPKELLREPLADIYQRAPMETSGRFEVKVVEIPTRKGYTSRIPVLDTVVRVQQGPTMAPITAWTRSLDGAKQFKIGRRTEQGEQPVYHDGILGALVVAYLAPQIRADKEIWPKEDGIPGGRNVTNQIAAAQVPVQVLRKQEHFLGSDFIRAAEALVT